VFSKKQDHFYFFAATSKMLEQVLARAELTISERVFTWKLMPDVVSFACLRAVSQK